jgi:hypothetical protein
MPRPMILTPWRPTATSYNLRFTVNGVTETKAFPAAGLLTVGRNYWPSGDGQADSDGGVGGVGDLFALLKATLDSHSDPAVFTAVLDASFRAVLTASAGTNSILWADAATTLDEALFGFTNANTASAISATGTLLPRYIWRPNTDGYLRSQSDRTPIGGGIATALSGAQRVAKLTAGLREDDVRFTFVANRYALQDFEDASEPYGSFEEAWLNSISLGRQFRIYNDETVRTSTSYRLYVCRSFKDPFSDTKDLEGRALDISLAIRRVA